MRRILLLFIFAMFPVPTVEAANHPATPASVQQPAVAEPQKQRIEAVIIRHQKSAPQIYESLEAMKKAKASYLQELTASTGKARKYHSKKSRRQMIGVYMFDMSYASVFNHKKQVKESAEAVQLLLKSLGVNDGKINQQYQRLLKEYETSTVQNLVLSYQKILNDSFREIASNEEGAALVSEAAYGWLLEWLFVTTEFIVQQNYSPQMMYIINEHAECIKPVVELMETIRNNPNLSRAVAASERLTVLTAISEKLKDAESISKREINAVRPIIGKARADIVN
jgi:hypothetical protein